MPPQMKKSGLMAKYGPKLDAAVKTHGADDTNYGIIRLPGGIKNGIAQLVDCKFDVYKSGAYVGEYYFRAAGVVVEPEAVKTPEGEIPVAGLQTSIMIAVCDTKKSDGTVITQEEHVADILNEMRKLGADTANAGVADLEPIAAALKEAAPYFRFETSQSEPTKAYPNPRVWENWFGVRGVENYQGATAPAVNDQTGDAGSQGGTIDPDSVDRDNLDAIAESADAGNLEAQAQLTAVATHDGITDEQMQGCGSWAEVVGILKGEGGDVGVNGFAVGNTYKYKPHDPKDKKKRLKPVDVEITAVDRQKEVVTIKRLDNQKVVYKDIKWSDLEPA